MTRFVARALNGALRGLGLRISRIAPSPNSAGDGTGMAYDAQRLMVQASNPVILDVGAHVGDVSRAYRRLFPDARIHAFEPFPASFEKLSNALQGMDSTYCHALAVSDSVGTLVLNTNRSSATNSLLKVDQQASSFWDGDVLQAEGTVTIRSTTLDQFCREQRIERVDILKLDVQGAEYPALQGARDLLAGQRIGLVFMEVILVPTYAGQRSLHDYLELFDAAGYVLLDFYNPVRSNSRLLQVDLIFLCKSLADARQRRGGNQEQGFA